jgi:hypothetical protein
MSITDKTRKILWGRSGNRCAVCRQKLVVDETEMDAESVVGEECHIVSGSLQGPRYNPRFPLEEVDEIANLLLLCGTHHKMIDDQCETYSADVLRSIKTDHEKWVEAKLKDEALLPPVRIRRFKDNIPAQLRFIPTGQEIFSLVTSCEGMYYYHPDNLSVDKVELVGGFLQDLIDPKMDCYTFQPQNEIGRL